MEQEKLQVVYKGVDEITPYINNPRNNEAAIDKVAASIKEFGFKVPIVIDKDNVIVTGHTRSLAAIKLGLKDIPCIYADDLTPAQIKAFRIADNKTSEFASWDEELLKVEIEALQEMGVNLGTTGFDDDEVSSILEGLAEELTEEEKYTKKVDVPQYEITGECPTFEEMYSTDKANELMQEIETADITEEEREFLKMAAMRHNVFNYRNIAEYYAHATPEMQRLMEQSALVIIDFEDAIRNGYVRISGLIDELTDEDIEDIEGGENA